MTDKNNKYNSMNKRERSNELVKDKEKAETVYDEYEIGEIIGNFAGYLQYSKPAKGLNGKSGMMAHIFGENGEDSDIITTLNLTKLLDLPVKVTIWGIKDKNGKLLKEKGVYPKYTQFIGRIHRPSSSISGLTAKLFGEDGGNADAINELNKTEFTQSLVLCQIQLAEADSLLSEIETPDPESLLENESLKLTPKELKILEKKQEKFREADNILTMSNFYGNPRVLDLLGKHEDYLEWIKTQECIVDHKTSTNIEPYILDEKTAYKAVPMNKMYHSRVATGELVEQKGIMDMSSYLRQWNTAMIQNFARAKIKEKLGIPEEYFLDPTSLYNWSVKAGLSKLIPLHYTHFIEKSKFAQ